MSSSTREQNEVRVVRAITPAESVAERGDGKSWLASLGAVGAAFVASLCCVGPLRGTHRCSRGGGYPGPHRGAGDGILPGMNLATRSGCRREVLRANSAPNSYWLLRGGLQHQELGLEAPPA